MKTKLLLMVIVVLAGGIGGCAKKPAPVTYQMSEAEMSIMGQKKSPGYFQNWVKDAKQRKADRDAER